jgi:hypothetical protein
MTPSSLSSNTATNSCSTTANASAWTDVDKTSKAIHKQNMQLLMQVAQDKFNKKVDRFYYTNLYKAAFKEATLEVAKNRDDPQKQGKRGNGVHAIIKQINDEKLLSPNDMKLKRGAVFNAVSRGILMFLS